LYKQIQAKLINHLKAFFKSKWENYILINEPEFECEDLELFYLIYWIYNKLINVTLIVFIIYICEFNYELVILIMLILQLNDSVFFKY